MKTNQTSGRNDAAKASPAGTLFIFGTGKSKFFDTVLLLLYIGVTIAIIKAVQIFLPDNIKWFIAPAVLVLSAVSPYIIKKHKLFCIGLTYKQIKNSFWIFIWTCLLTLLVEYCGLLFLKKLNLDFPLRPVIPQNYSLVSWFFYQFMYIAVAEEFFFRGFVQGSFFNFLRSVIPNRRLTQYTISLVISSACFAAAHMIMQGNILSVITFIPGLVMGWLYIKTEALLAPILFHGIANVGYWLTAAIMAG